MQDWVYVAQSDNFVTYGETVMTEVKVVACFKALFPHYHCHHAEGNRVASFSYFQKS